MIYGKVPHDKGKRSKRPSSLRNKVIFTGVSVFILAFAVIYLVGPTVSGYQTGENTIGDSSPIREAGLDGETDYSDRPNDEISPYSSEVQDANAGGEGETFSPTEEYTTISTPGGEVVLPARAYIDYRESSYQPGVILVQPRDGVDAASIIDVLDSNGAPGAKLISEGDGYLSISVPEGLDVSGAAAILRVQDCVDGAQPNFTYQVMESEGKIGLDSLSSGDSRSARVFTLGSPEKPNDPLIDDQWALESMKVYEAWNTVKTDGSVAVAVIDQAFNAGHPDLKENVVATYNAAGGGTDVSSPGKMQHGTHVAGIVGGIADNGREIAGVSHNAKLVLIKVLDSNGLMTTESIRAAYDYITRYNSSHSVKIRVANMSLGTVASKEITDPLVYDRIDSAYQQGIVTVCAAGNSSTAPVPFKNFPADYNTVVSVINLEKSYSGGVWKSETRNPTSNYNTLGQTTKDIAAPGTDILSLDGESSGYTYNSGTSMASPAVAGVFALIFAKNSQLSAQQAVDIVYSTTKDLGAAGFDRWYGYGEVNAAAAVKGIDGYLSGGNAVSVGATLALKPAHATGPWTWSSSDNNVATVTDGKVTGVNAGFARITAKGNGKTLSRTVAVYPKLLSGSSTVIRGKSITLKPSSSPIGTWKYSSSNTAVATVNASGVVTGKTRGTAVITATHAYHGTIKMTKTVQVTATSVATATVSSIPEQTYTGKAITPKPTVKVAGKTLKLNTDYTLGYANNVASGTATITITGKNAYDGTKKVTFKIAKAWSVSGTNRMPVGSTAVWSCKNCTLKVLSGSTAVSVSKSILTTKAAGVAKIGVYNTVGRLVAAKTITVYHLTDAYYIGSSQNKNLVFDVNGASKADGSNVSVWKINGGKNQQFRFYRQSDGYYEIRCVQSGKLVGISNGSKANGGNAVQWARHGGANQRWTITVDVNNQLTFVNKNSRKALDIHGMKAKSGANIEQWTNLGRKSQKWTLIKV